MSSQEDNYSNRLNIPLPANHNESYQETKAQAQTWLLMHASKVPAFEAYLQGGKLSPASEFATTLYQDDTNTVGGIKFKRAIRASDTTDSLQEALDFCCPNSVTLPGLRQHPDWDVTARFPCSQVTHKDNDRGPGDTGHTITIDSWDGSTLCWTIHNARFFAIGGDARITSKAMTNLADCPRPEGSYWQIRQDFRGTIHYECKVAGSGIGSSTLALFSLTKL